MSCCYYFIHSVTGAVEKYCNKYVCVSVCISVREHISRTTRTIFTNFVPVAYRPDLGPPPLVTKEK